MVNHASLATSMLFLKVKYYGPIIMDNIIIWFRSRCTFIQKRKTSTFSSVAVSVVVLLKGRETQKNEETKISLL